jgi:colicin import membrane protein
MESIGDKTRAFIYALLVHLACIAVMFIGLLWTKAAAPISVPGPIIEAELVGPSAAPKPVPAARPKPTPQKPVEKPPEKPPEPPPPQPAEPPKTDAIEREKIAEIALQKAEQEKKAEEEKRRREQTLLEDQQRERLKQIEDIKRQREAAEKKRKLEQEKLAQLQDLSKQKPQKAPPQKQQPAVPEADVARTGTNGNDTGLLAEYSAAIINVVKLNWNRPDNAQPGLRCTLRVIQLPGGDVMSAQAVPPCNADQVTRASIEEAVTKAQPLPYKGYEKVFSRELTLIFFYDGN